MLKTENLIISIKQKKLITQLNLAMKAGQFWAIIGKNGTGKSTLLKTISGFLSYYSGTILINDKNIHEYSALTKAQNISYLPQNLEQGLNCSVKQCISYSRYPWHKNNTDSQKDDEIIAQTIQDMELAHIKEKSIMEISGGEYRKTEIATTLAQNSPIMMFDEPLNHLDISFKYKLLNILKKLSQNKLIIMVTHDIQYVQEYCTHIIMLKDEKNHIVGTTSKIMTNDNVEKFLDVSLSNHYFFK